MPRRIFLLIVVVSSAFVAACTTWNNTSMEFKSVEATQTYVSENSNYEAYLITSGVWLENQPILVNNDFDFGMAMGLDGIGPAIAAGTRIKNNNERAAALSGLDSIDLPALFESSGLANLIQETNITLFGILYGKDEVHLQSVIEVENEGVVTRYIVVSTEKPAENWINGGKPFFDSEFKAGYKLLTSALESCSFEKPVATTDDNNTRKGRFKGWLVECELADVIYSATMAETLILIST